MPENIGKVSLTELVHFRVLVAFLCTIEQLAQERDDDELKQLVEDVRLDLAALS
jgi:hypothetical protein